ncbi:ATP-binding cassette domain-containing protein [Alteromonadaceae bacterium M269]|nr:ATP-binding cassette domain-containing protein [Alteromonadaceae bacterium M269]
MTTLLSVQDLNFYHKSRNSFLRKQPPFHLTDINFSINAGETLAIVGDNGSGKSTLANLLVGVYKPSSGSISLNDQQLGSRNTKQRCLNIRMIFQNTKESINPALTLGHMLDESLVLNTKLSALERGQQIDKTLRLVGLLPEHKYFYRHMLSDGQLQRMALARALILNPKVIVADEPFAALDPSVRSQTINLFMKLQKDLGLGFVFIAHNLGIVRHISDRMLVIQDGRVVESGKTEVLINWPKSEYTKQLIHSYYSLVNGQY